MKASGVYDIAEGIIADMNPLARHAVRHTQIYYYETVWLHSATSVPKPIQSKKLIYHVPNEKVEEFLDSVEVMGYVASYGHYVVFQYLEDAMLWMLKL